MIGAWVYVESERYTDDDGCVRALYTVGFEDAAGKWHGDSDHAEREQAATRCALLNGQPQPLNEECDEESDESIWERVREHRRYEIAMRVMAGFAANSAMVGLEVEARIAVKWADALLYALEKDE